MVTVGRIALTDHPTDPSLQVGWVCGKQVVVGRHYDPGIIGFFIPAGAIVPEKLAVEMWVCGRLAGKKKNRVKETVRRGVLSEGLFYGSRYFVDEGGGDRVYYTSPSWNPAWVEGQDVAQEVGITFAEDRK